MRKNTSKIFLLLFLLVQTFGHCLAPKTTAESFTLNLDHIIDFFSINAFTEEQWKNITDEELARLSLIGKEIQAERERIYANRSKTYTQYKSDFPYSPQLLEDAENYVLETAISNKDIRSDGFLIGELVSILDLFFKERTERIGPLSRILTIFKPKKKTPKDIQTQIQGLFQKFQTKYDQIQEHLLVLQAPTGIKKILIAEDEEKEITKLIEGILEYDSGIEILHASTGRGALDLFKKNSGIDIDLVISDQNMLDSENPLGPHLSGMQLIHEIKGISERPRVFCWMNTTEDARSHVHKKDYDGIVSRKSDKIYLIPMLLKLNIEKTRAWLEDTFKEKGVPIYRSYYLDLKKALEVRDLTKNYA